MGRPPILLFSSQRALAARASSQCPVWMQEPRDLDHLLLLYQADEWGAGLQMEQLEFVLVPMWDASIADNISRYTTMPTLRYTYLDKAN